MAVIIRNKTQYDDAVATLEDLKKARHKILVGGQSYTIGATQMNRASLSEITEEIHEYEQAIDAYETRGTSKRRVARAVPL
ncbi:hypothetical protein [Pseudobutyrivibrio sp.]|uniref:hypothetical protein n=1 Tax=Pseudobutyrivibrio sp. TaxID=2014367 RepID=UPI001D41D62C|nr:hypothetical protein [Pseudobutyrivibrio sp.]MBE5910897.1 hypothetical protein [Pseudobutyrivibrio sp.]